MNILVTAGGTAEKIDQVRSITNHSTGKLGQLIATQFLAKGHQVTYLSSPQAFKPEQRSDLLTLLEITSTEELQRTLIALFETQKFDGIIHSMAVSDFTPEYTLSEGEFIHELLNFMAAETGMQRQTLQEELKSWLEKFNNSEKQKKISSDTNRLLLFLKKNPKIIAMLKTHQPHAILVGFKLLVAVPTEHLLTVAQQTLEKNHCDFVLANDLSTIQGEQHVGYLLKKDKSYEIAYSKKEIAQVIVENIEKIGE